MLALLLPLAWLGCVLLMRELGARGRVDEDWRMSFVLGSTAWGALLVLGTELVSLGGMLNATMVALFWVVANAGLWGGIFLWRKRSPAVKKAWTAASIWRDFQAWPLDARLMAGAAVL